LGEQGREALRSQIHVSGCPCEWTKPTEVGGGTPRVNHEETIAAKG